MAGSNSQWELSKENILPMKAGRDVKELNAALSEEHAKWKEQRLHEWRSFQDRIMSNESNHEEYLNCVYDLLCWLETSFPQGGKKYIKTHAKRCFHKLKDNKSFYSNWKFMKIILKYIEASGESCKYISDNAYCDLYNYMFHNRIGTMHADFFVSWANALEASESYPQAAAIFKKGLEMNAEPQSLLEKERKLFEDRMAIRTIEDMMQEEGKLSIADRRQPLQQQGKPVSRAPVVTGEDATVRSRAPDTQKHGALKANVQQTFSVHKSESVRQSSSHVPAFSAVSSASATNVVPIKHIPEKENTQLPEKWAKPGNAFSKHSKSFSASSSKTNKQSRKTTSTSFQVYCDEPEESMLSSSTNKVPVLVGQSVLRVRKDDETEDADNLLSKNSVAANQETKKLSSSQPEAKVKFMFCEDAVMNGPFGEMSFEELRADHMRTVLENGREAQLPTNTAAFPNQRIDANMTGFLSNDDEGDEKQDNEADFTVAITAELTHLSKPDARTIGKAAVADSFMMSASVAEAVSNENNNNPQPVNALDSWAIGPNETAFGNDTTEVVRLSRDSDTSHANCTSNGTNSNKLSVTQFDCLNRILSEAFRGPSAGPSFGVYQDDMVSSESMSGVCGGQSEQNAFVPFHDSINASSSVDTSKQPLNNDAPKASFMLYEDSFVPQDSGKATATNKAPGLKVRIDDKDFEKQTPSSMQVDAAVKSTPGFAIYEDSFAQEAEAALPPHPPQKRQPLQICVEDKDKDFTDSADGLAIDNDNSPIISDSPLHKRQRVNQQPPLAPSDLFSEADGVVECSGIVGDFPMSGDIGGTGGNNRFSLSTTIDFNGRGMQPKFCSTQYVDVNQLQTGAQAEANEQHQNGGSGSSDPSYFQQNAASANAGGLKRPPGARRQSITARVSTMPPLQERSESSSSGGSTMAGCNTMHSVAAVRDTGLTAIWESTTDPSAKKLDDDSAALPTMNCENQKSRHHIDIEKYITYSQLQQSVNFGDKTFSCLREIDPTDPFSDELIARFVKKYEPSMEKLPNYTIIKKNVPKFNTRQSGAGKIIQLSSDCNMSYAFRVGNGSFASVVAARDENRRLVALKFQMPACKWEFYVVNELRQRLTKKTQLRSIMNGVMEIERAFIYNDGSCHVMQHARFGSILNLVNKSREHKLELSEPIAMLLTIELLRIVETIHRCHIIHADLKPDNVLFLGLPELPKSTRNAHDQQTVFPLKDAAIKVIDFGRSIDMTLFPPQTMFLAKVATSGFDCIEMKTDRPWTYQTDFFGIAGTVHVLVFQDYMRVSWQESTNRWWIEKKFKRWWHHNDLFESLFDRLLNIADCDHQPNIKTLREAFEQRFVEKALSSYAVSQSSVMTTMKEQFTSH